MMDVKQVIDAVIGFLERNESVLLYISYSLGGILILLVLLLLVKKLFYQKGSRKLSKSLKSSGVTLVLDKSQKKKFFSRLFSKKKGIDSIVHKVQDIINSERELKGEEQLLIKKIEDLYHKTRPMVEEAPSFAATEKKDAGIDDDTKRVLQMADDLLEKLPDDVVDEFVNSKDFKLYQKVLKKAKT